ncbi:MAG: CHAT domain-containing protein [Pirellulaceae bacterium]|nr:CHAT domain-containing protein [Pirellulaceae bacterium]
MRVSSLPAQDLLPGVEPASSYPSVTYYQALDIYRSGDLPTANKAFEAALRSSRVDINGRWIDAIPVYAMMAECQWHLGDLVATRQNLDNVYQIAIRYRGWLGRPDWASVLQANVQRTPPPGLWPQAASVNRLPIASKLQYASGQRITAPSQLRGTIEEYNVKVIDVVEIMRGLSIASYRRRMLLGSLADQDPLTREVLDATKYPADVQIPIARALMGSVRATERFANHEDQQAVTDAMKSSVVNNGVHPLSPLAQLCQASAIAGSDKPHEAVPVAANVVNIAASLGHYEVVGEAMQLAAGCANEQQAGVVRVSAETAATSLIRKSRLAALHCMVAGADAAVTAGELDAASQLLNQAQAMVGRRDVFQPRLNAYGGYVAARLAAARGDAVGMVAASEVDQALDLMNAFALNRKDRNRPLISMPRIYQMELIRQSMGKQLGGESSDKLLERYTNEPPPELWRRDPVDALSSTTVDRTVPHTARLQIAAYKKQGTEVLARMDELLSHRFLRRLAMGGRITQVRSLVRGDDKVIGKEAAEFRNKAPKNIKALRQAVVAPPPADKDALLLAANRMESLATQIALSRVTLPRTMLPPLQEKTAVARLPDRTGLLTFVSVDNRLYVTLAAEGKVEFWTVGGAARIPGEIGRLLVSIGVGKARGKRLPEDDTWRRAAVTLRRHLFPDDTTISADRFDQLIIVPDSALWYLPFEMLPIEGDQSPLIGDRIKIRYAATPGLAFQPTGPRATSRAVAIAADMFFAPRDLELNETITQSLADSVNDSIRIPQKLNVPSSLLADSVGHLLVAAPVAPNPKNAFATNVGAYDRGTPAGTLAAWMRFPAKTPESVLLAGFRSSVDQGKMGSGEDLFLTVCALQSSGVRNVMVSRWIVGGESSAIAMRELLQELPFSGMNESWARARAVLRRSELDPVAEPLLRQSEHEIEGLTGDQPFFWASYLVAAPLAESELKPPGAITPKK